MRSALFAMNGASGINDFIVMACGVFVRPSGEVLTRMLSARSRMNCFRVLTPVLGGKGTDAVLCLLFCQFAAVYVRSCGL